MKDQDGQNDISLSFLPLQVLAKVDSLWLLGSSNLA